MIWKQPQCPLIEEWINKMWYTYTNGILLSHKKECSRAILTTWMDLEDIMLSEVSGMEKDKYHMITLICGI